MSGMLKQLILITVAFTMVGCATLTSKPQTSDKCTTLKRDWVFQHSNRNAGMKGITAHQRAAFKQRMVEAGCIK
jgi:hypothetical protein